MAAVSPSRPALGSGTVNDEAVIVTVAGGAEERSMSWFAKSAKRDGGVRVEVDREGVPRVGVSIGRNRQRASRQVVPPGKATLLTSTVPSTAREALMAEVGNRQVEPDPIEIKAIAENM